MSNLFDYVIFSILLCWFFETNAYHDQQERAGYKMFSHNWKERPRANSLEKHNYARFIPQIGQDMRPKQKYYLGRTKPPPSVRYSCAEFTPSKPQRSNVEQKESKAWWGKENFQCFLYHRSSQHARHLENLLTLFDGIRRQRNGLQFQAKYFFIMHWDTLN